MYSRRYSIAKWPVHEATNWPRGTYLNPALLLHVKAIVLGLGAVDSDPLARRSELIGGTDGQSLPVLHLGKRERTRRGTGRRCHRHQTTRPATGQAQRGAKSGTGLDSEAASKPRLVPGPAAQALIQQEELVWHRDADGGGKGRLSQRVEISKPTHESSGLGSARKRLSRTLFLVGLSLIDSWPG